MLNNAYPCSCYKDQQQLTAVNFIILDSNKFRNKYYIGGDEDLDHVDEEAREHHGLGYICALAKG
jgi:hypothetical protein